MRLAPAEVALDKRADGSVLLRSPQKLGPYARCVTEWLVQWSDRSPERVFLAERAASGVWRKTTYREAYGAVRPDELPIGEETPFRPTSPYGVSKVAQDVMALQYFQSHRLHLVRARSFNHIGPGQSDDFAASAFARQIAEIEAGRRPPVVRVGNLDSERDFTDVRDVVRAYWLLAQQGAPGEAYNVGSGVARPTRWLLETLLDLAQTPVSVETDPERMRPSDVPRSVCDNRKLVEATGWQPEIALRDSLCALLDDWRQTPA